MIPIHWSLWVQTPICSYKILINFSRILRSYFSVGNGGTGDNFRGRGIKLCWAGRTVMQWRSEWEEPSIQPNIYYIHVIQDSGKGAKKHNQQNHFLNLTKPPSSRLLQEYVEIRNGAQKLFYICQSLKLYGKKTGRNITPFFSMFVYLAIISNTDLRWYVLEDIQSFCLGKSAL